MKNIKVGTKLKIRTIGNEGFLGEKGSSLEVVGVGSNPPHQLIASTVIHGEEKEIELANPEYRNQQYVKWFNKTIQIIN